MVPGNVRIRGRPVPLAALAGIPLVCALWAEACAFAASARRASMFF